MLDWMMSRSRNNLVTGDLNIFYQRGWWIQAGLGVPGRETVASHARRGFRATLSLSCSKHSSSVTLSEHCPYRL